LREGGVGGRIEEGHYHKNFFEFKKIRCKVTIASRTKADINILELQCYLLGVFLFVRLRKVAGLDWRLLHFFVYLFFFHCGLLTIFLRLLLFSIITKSITIITNQCLVKQDYICNKNAEEGGGT